MFARKYMAAALVGSALMATAAMAQTTTPPTATTPTNDRTSASPASAADASFHGDWRASKVVGLNVYNDSNEKLGSIDELLFDKSGKIQAAVIGVGGFLGVGTRDVAVAFDQLKFVNEPVASTSASAGSSTMRTSPGTTTGAAPAAPAATKSNPWYPDHAVFNATKDQLKTMPQFKYSE